MRNHRLKRQRSQYSARRRSLWFLCAGILGTLLILTSCDRVGNAPQARKTPRPTTNTPHPTATPDPYAWVWQSEVPQNRLLLYYYIPGAPWGFLGTYNDNDLLARAQAQSQQYADLDPSHPVVSGLDIASPVVQADPGPDGYYTVLSPPDLMQHYLDLATQNHMLFFMDMQIGRAPLQQEVAAFWSLLQQPNVELALDPEFDVAPDGIPDVTLGHMMASDINEVVNELARIVQEAQLPPKVLVIHEWQPSMLPDWYNIKPKPGVNIIICSDGFGSPGAKIGDYELFDHDQPIQYPGFKLFYPNFPGASPHPTLDDPLMSPADVLNLQPAPVMVMYQ